MSNSDISNSSRQRIRPELLAPAGDQECITAAIENGADAIYFGLDCGFNARARAKNFQAADLPQIMETLHRRGVCGYVTLNTLVFPSELESAAEVLRKISAAGVDAVLIQDLGMVRLIREMVPDLPIHASTQMTMTSAECIAEIEKLGVERVVLGRELSVREIKSVAAKTEMPLEVFVHGALCVAYSGQCLTSESLGGRSANRGQCAQACRLPYELIVDGEDRDLGDQKYLLSPQDLAAYALIPDLIDAGVCSLKIEGRLKTPEYVANITGHYRQAIDQAMQNQSVHFNDQEVREMELSFSRGFSPGWLDGSDHKMLVPGLSSAKRGVRLGRVDQVGRNSVVVTITAPVARGDGVVFEGDRAAGEEQGGRVYEVRGNQQRLPAAVELEFGSGAIDFSKLTAGQILWKTDDPKLNERLRRSYRQKHPSRKTKLSIQAFARAGDPLEVHASLAGLDPIRLYSDQPMQLARKHPVSEAVLTEQLGRLGNTPFELDSLKVEIEGQPMLPLSVLGRLRKKLISTLNDASVKRGSRRFEPEALSRLRSQVNDATESSAQAAADSPRIHLLCRTLQQLECAVNLGLKHLYADFHDIREFRAATELAKTAGVSLYLATPRIQKPDEFGLFRAMRRHQPDGYLVRNLAGLRYFLDEGFEVVADFSLNVTNELTAHYFKQQGVSRFTASYDLNRQQIVELLSAIPTGWTEIVIHQHMPMFHMEHCVFCSVISPGTNKTNCGRPCDHHEVKLRDRVGMEHPLQADVGCRNTLFNSVAQSAAEVVPQLVKMQVSDFRIELLEENPAEIEQIVSIYQSLLAGEISGHEVWKSLNASNRVGVTRGTLEEKRNPLAII